LPITEADWWAATDPDPLIDWLFFDALAADRKLRLFSVAACAPLRRLVGDPGVLAGLDLAEAFADGQVDSAALASARSVGWARLHTRQPDSQALPREVGLAELVCFSPLFGEDAPRDRESYPGEEDIPYALSVAQGIHHLAPRATAYLRLVRLLHDIFGPLPFRELSVDSRWLTSDVVALARGGYDEKAFDRMPILADALQDAGCDNGEMLNHCRAEKWEHVRGCWAVDLLLGKPWREDP
jgi:hypothetical protein